MEKRKRRTRAVLVHTLTHTLYAKSEAQTIERIVTDGWLWLCVHHHLHHCHYTVATAADVATTILPLTRYHAVNALFSYNLLLLMHTITSIVDQNMYQIKVPRRRQRWR